MNGQNASPRPGRVPVLPRLLAATALAGCADVLEYTRSASLPTDALSISVQASGGFDKDFTGPLSFHASVRRTDLVQDCSGFLSFCDSTSVRLTDGDRIVLSQGERRAQLYRVAEPYTYSGRLAWRPDGSEPLVVRLSRPRGGPDAFATFELPRVAQFAIEEAGTVVPDDAALTASYAYADPTDAHAPSFVARASRCIDETGVEIDPASYAGRDVQRLFGGSTGRAGEGRATLYAGLLRAPPNPVRVAQCDWDVALGAGNSVRTDEEGPPGVSLSLPAALVPLSEFRTLTVLYAP